MKQISIDFIGNQIEDIEHVKRSVKILNSQLITHDKLSGSKSKQEEDQKHFELSNLT